ncbi:MAG: PLP-dependent transferase [Acidobacteria bacterium]|nr:PLP-dependent transferase [Acidobacteriota bacterium]
MKGYSTKAIHAGQEPDPTTGAIITPIYQTSTYIQEAVGVHKGYDYARTINPTRVAVERNIAALENGAYGLAFASGMAAITAVMSLLKSGEHVIASRNVYGGTFRLFDMVLTRQGLSFTWVDTSDLASVADAIRPQTRMLYVETPTNPTMVLTDLAAASRLARERDLILVVDNTFMSPYFQRPLDHGAAIVVHSTTKYLNGHSDSIGGAIVCNEATHYEWLKFIQNSSGAILSPFDSWLLLRGTKTLALRMEKHNSNAMIVAQFLAKHPAVTKVNYPGLASHPQHELAGRQASGFGGMISFDVGDGARARELLKTVRLCTLAESLGGVETLICHPAMMTHAIVPAEVREELGITDGLVRLSVGCEDAEDIVDDLATALA